MVRRLQAAGLILLLVVLFVALNVAAGGLLRSTRLDVTQGRVFTLTKGSAEIARMPDEPVRLTFFYSAKQAQGRPEIQSYARRVRETLEEYARASGGRVMVEHVEPEQFSEDEDRAVRAGLIAVPVSNAGDTLFLGLAGVNSTDGKEVIPFFDPRKERFLEYDISRLISSLANPAKKVVGLISGLPLEGGFTMDPRTRQPSQAPAWQIDAEIKSLFEVRNLGAPAAIPADISVLMVVHPKDLTEQTLFAIDQFVLRGGRLLAFIDPLCENDDSGGQFAFAADRSSDLARLMDAWGVEMAPGKLAADDTLAMRVYVGQRNNPEVVPYVVMLAARGEALSKEDAVTGALREVRLSTAGVLRVKEGAAGGLTLTPLITTGPTAMEFPVGALGMPPDPKAVMRQYAPGSKALTVAARLTGRAKTAFPDGRPALKEGEAPPEADAAAPLAGSAEDVQVIVVADCDLLADQMWVQVQNFLGQRFATKMADNGDLVMSALDNLTGSDALISVRARRESNRPFTTVEKMQREADQRLLQEQTLLEAKVEETTRKLQELQQKRADGALVLSPEQQAEVDEFNAELLDTRRRLREVRRSLREDIERLGVQLKLINTALIPALVALFAVGLGAARRARRAASVKRGTRE